MNELETSGLSELLDEIQLSRFDLRYTKILAHAFMKASESERRLIEDTIKDTIYVEAIRTYLEVPTTVKTINSKINEFPSFYSVKMLPETENLINAEPIYQIPLTLTLVDGSLATFQEVFPVENSILPNLSNLWRKSKKKIAASVVATLMLAPISYEFANKNWSSYVEEFTFSSPSHSNYAEDFNEGINELAKAKSARLTGMLADLTDQEMKFFISNLERAQNPLLNKEEVELQMAIEHLYSAYKVKNSAAIAKSIKKYADQYELDPLLFLSIIKVESGFDQQAYNPSGDFSIAQINYKIWSEAFKDLKKEPLDKEKLKTDSDYAISRMAEILDYLKDSYSDHDPLWYARYHNWKERFKMPYAKKVNTQLKNLENMQMEKIAAKLLEMKTFALRIAENEDAVNLEKVKKFITSLEKVYQEYSNSQNVTIAMAEE